MELSKIAICKSSQTTAPSSYDVLLGPGFGYINHVGNVRYPGMVEELKEKYDKSKRAGKQQATKDIVMVIHELGCRFLKYEGGIWIQVDAKVASQKVAHSFLPLRSSSSSVEPKTMKLSAGAKATNRDEKGVTAPTMKRMARD